MANKEHLAILEEGAENWNKWRRANPDIRPDLSDAHLNGVQLHSVRLSQADLSDVDLRRTHLFAMYLSGADLTRADLRGADLFKVTFNKANLRNAQLRGAKLYEPELIETDLRGADLREASFSWANLSSANLSEADLQWTSLIGANLRNADLSKANLSGADLSETDLRGADLMGARLVETNFTNANLSSCRTFGVSAWEVKLTGATQTDLIITRHGEPVLTVDNLEVAQFIYLLIHNEKIRDVIQTIGNKAVLILGRFADDKRKGILDALRKQLRQEHLLPIIFDFEKATNVDFTETVNILAGMSLFVIADITAPKSTPLELQATIPNYMVPFVPIIQKGEQPFSMFVDLQHKYRWVMDILVYETEEQLIEYMPSKIIKPALEKHDELIALKNQALKYRDISES
ncbi:MAG: pentapeptide repeat-containing protein [Anaerolineae bacterium]|nr:pentapeptide repeat-containing protein [Anaerolineae bacterium]